MKKLNKKGVSLPEMLAIVVIMGLVAAITIPLIGKTIDNARRKAFLGDVIAIKEAVQLYCNANEDDDLNYICADRPSDEVFALVTVKAGSGDQDVINNNRFGLTNNNMGSLSILATDAIEDMEEFEESLSNPLSKIVGVSGLNHGLWIKNVHGEMQICLLGEKYRTGAKGSSDNYESSWINPIDNTIGTKDKVQPRA